MRAYGIKQDGNDQEGLNKSRVAGRHGAGNAESKRASRRHAKRRARVEGKKAAADGGGARNKDE